MLDINLTVIVMMALFLAFAVLMDLVFFKPVTRVLEDRKAYVARQQEQATTALKQVQDLQVDYESRLKSAHGQAQDAIKAAIKEAEVKRQALLDGVKVDLEKELTTARASIRAERATALASLEGEVGSFSELIKRKVAGSSPAYSAAGGGDA